MKFLKYGALALLVLVIAVAVFVATLDLNSYKDRIAAQVQAATGRELVIEGDLSLAPSLVPTLAAESVTLGNASWGTRPHMLSVGRFQASLALLPLLSNEVQLKRLELADAEVFLETSKDGKGNWILKGQKAQPAPAPDGEPGAAPVLRLGQIGIENTRIVFRDGASGETTTFAVAALDLEGGGPGEPLGVRLKARYNDMPLELEGTVGSLATIVGGQPFPVDLKGKVDAAPPLSLLSPIAITGQVKADGEAGVLEISDLALQAGETRLNGRLSARQADGRNRVEARLAAPVIDLRPFQPEEEQEQKKKRIFSRDPLPVAVLRTTDLDVELNVTELRTRDAILSSVQIPVMLVGGKLSVSPFKAGVAGGTITTDLALDASGTPRLDLDLRLAGVELGALEKIREKKTLEGGVTDMTLKLSGSGESVAAIMGGADGALLVQVGPAKLANKSVDLAGADLLFETFNRLNPLADKEPSTELECAVVNFSIKDGTATTDKGIAVKTPKMSMVGSGAIDLKTEQLDIGIRPYAQKGVGVGLGTIAGAARIGGTLTDPKPVIDAANALRAGATAGAAVMTFGLSTLAQGVFDRQTADPQPCETALGKAPSKQASTTEEQPATDSATTKKNPVEGAADKVKGALKGLFGD